MAIREGLTLRQAALIAGFGYLLDPVTYAEFTLYPKLVIPGNIDQTVANISSHHALFVAAMFCYLVNFIEDIVVAWALYVLLLPVNRSVSLLAALFRIIFATIALVGTFNMATVYRMLTTPEYLSVFGSAQLHAQVDLLLHSFRINYSLSLVIFGIHLILVGALIYWSRYMPKWLGIILVINGLGWIVSELQPYLWPTANLGFLFFTYFGELVFMLWLLIVGWRIKEPAAVLE
ncbi:MAG: DUF4386 domain-containing protein [Candidatus Eremiobacteraeota bacterium]|nr:DUF4386 domain-containing protein [Candidatus Eremiobacteraeota bacterium]